MPCILVQNIGIIQNQPKYFQPYTQYTTNNNNNTSITNNNAGYITPSKTAGPMGVHQPNNTCSIADQVFGLTENVQRWSLDQNDAQMINAQRENSFKSIDMRGHSGSISGYLKPSENGLG